MDGFDAMDKELEDFKRNFGKEERDLTPRERYSYKRSVTNIGCDTRKRRRCN